MKKDKLKIFKNIPQLSTDRLILRRMTLEDLKDVYEYASDPTVSEYLMWYPHKNIEYTKMYLRYLEKLYKKGKFYDWGIVFNDKLIGTVGFTSINLKTNVGEIGYVLNRSLWGKGIASEAVREVLKFGFSVLGFDRVEAIILPENKRSRALLTRCLFSFQEFRNASVLIKGMYRDVEVFSITKEQYFKGINI